MTNSEGEASENTPCIPIGEQDRLFFVSKINQIVSTMSLQELEETLDFIEIMKE
jgi:hypothetical protein